MKYIKYNNEKISKLSLGTVQFGLEYGIANKDGKPTENSVKEMLDYVVSEGINCFDTAQEYGKSETILGNNLVNKQNQFVVSKIKSVNFNNILEKVALSLLELKVNSLYALLLHDSKLLSQWDSKKSETIKKLLDSKKIKYFGVSIYTVDDFDIAIENEDIKVIQIPFNLFDQRAITNRWFKRAEEKNKLLFVRSVFLQGMLLMDKKDISMNLQGVYKYIDKLDLLCEKYTLSRHEIALYFVNTVAKNSSILFGCDNLQQAKQNISIFNRFKMMDTVLLQEIYDSFKDVEEAIYNPSKWNNV